jgi:hypothetical protein
MPLHDWTRVPSGLFHDFHQSWSIRIKDALNAGRLPSGTIALVEQRPGVRADRVRRSDWELYADRANRIVLQRHLRQTVAAIEIISPGNKGSRSALRDFVDKTVEFLRQGAHVLIIDVFPPTPRDPAGIHNAIWDEIGDEYFGAPPGKDRTLVSYRTGDERVAYAECVAVGDVLCDMPLFLTSDLYVPVPLESTYQATWDATPEEVRVAVETGVLPDPE